MILYNTSERIKLVPSGPSQLENGISRNLKAIIPERLDVP